VVAQAKSVAHRSFLEVTVERLDALCAAVGFDARARAIAISTVEDVLAPWGHWSISDSPRSCSDITDDHGPIEFSLALNGGSAEVRLLFEAQAESSEMMAQWAVGQEVNTHLGRRYGASLERLRAVEDLFVPTAREARWAVWHSLCFDGSAAPQLKVYLNPQAQGRQRAPAVVAETLARLGLADAASGVVRCNRRGDELKFFSLDLDDPADARVKVYKVHHDAVRADIEAELKQARDYRPELLSSFFDTIAASDGPFIRLPVSTYLSLTSAEESPTTATIHFPVRAYADSDERVYQRVCAFLDGDDRALYQRAITAFARRPLAHGIGMQSYVSIRMHRGARRVTVYLAPELYEVVPPRPTAVSVPRALVDDAAIERAANDMGGLVRRRPGAVARPRSVGDLQEILRFAHEQRIGVAIRGQAHTAFGQSQIQNGIAVDMTGLDRIHYIGSDRAVVDAGVTWRRLLTATAAQGLRPAVLTAFQGLSVGGTLSVGGLSGMSYKRGAQIDHVLELEVVTGDGRRVTCSPERQRELFDAVLGGLGQCAVIATAIIRLRPLARRVRHVVLSYSQASPFLRDLRMLVRRGELDGISGTITPGPSGTARYDLNAFHFSTPPDDSARYCCWRGLAPDQGRQVTDLDYLDQYLQVDRLIDTLGPRWSQHLHPWFDVFLPDDAVDSYLGSVVPTLDPAVDVGPVELGALGQAHLFPLLRHHLHRPLLRVPPGELAFLFDILTASHRPGRDDAYAARMLARNRHLFEHARDLGGASYPIAAIPMDASDWRRHFGDAFALLQSQKRLHDPLGILNPGCGIFPCAEA
jgi:DMATS type aromatic prenyltransferase